MTVIARPKYRPFPPFNIGHFQTIYPTLFRPTPKTHPIRERIELNDGDFIDIDWHKCGNSKPNGLVVVSHGLEGNSRKKYVLGMAKQCTTSGWDVICLNFRGCSGEPNRLPRLYHSGVTDDLHTVIQHGIAKGEYEKVALVGFSMGGNQTLKYLGENPDTVPAQVQAAVVFSVPCALADSVEVMNSWDKRLYMEYFMKGLSEKVRIKAELFPELIDVEGLSSMKTFEPFDDKYTAAIHGFENAADYYAKCSSNQFLHNIKIPTLMIQAIDDPFLSPSCYPVSEAENNPFLFLAIPEFGGHVGFVGNIITNVYWSEARTTDFLKAMLR